MKKILAIVMAMAVIVSPSAQSLTDNYNKIYAGWNSMGFEDTDADNLNGFNVGYAYAFNITGHAVPLFLEVGAEYNYVSHDYDGNKNKASNVTIPVLVTYKFGNEKINFAPFLGEGICCWTTLKDGDIDCFDIKDSKGDKVFNRVQALFYAGFNIGFAKHFNVGYRYAYSETKMAKDISEKVGDITNYSDSKNNYVSTIYFSVNF